MVTANRIFNSMFLNRMKSCLSEYPVEMLVEELKTRGNVLRDDIEVKSLPGKKVIVIELKKER